MNIHLIVALSLFFVSCKTSNISTDNPESSTETNFIIPAQVSYGTTNFIIPGIEQQVRDFTSFKSKIEIEGSSKSHSSDTLEQTCHFTYQGNKDDLYNELQLFKDHLKDIFNKQNLTVNNDNDLGGGKSTDNLCALEFQHSSHELAIRCQITWTTLADDSSKVSIDLSQVKLKD